MYYIYIYSHVEESSLKVVWGTIILVKGNQQKKEKSCIFKYIIVVHGFRSATCGNKGSQNYPAERKCHILVKLPSIAHFQNDDAMIDSPPNSCIYRLPNCKSVCP